MNPGDEIFVSFEDSDGETSYVEALLLVLNEESKKAKVATKTPGGYGETMNFVRESRIFAESPKVSEE